MEDFSCVHLFLWYLRVAGSLESWEMGKQIKKKDPINFKHIFLDCIQNYPCLIKRKIN